MTTLNIGGKRVRVGDDFRNLTPEQQAATVDEIARSIGASQPARMDRGHSNVPEFSPPGVEGYDPQTGEVTRPGYQPSRVTAALGSFIEGVPVAGPYLQSGVENAAAGINSLISGRPHADVRADMGDMVDQSQAAYPWTSTAAGVGGAVAGTIPAVVAAPTLFGAGGGTLVARTAASALSGAAVGGADSGVRSDWDPWTMLYGGGAGLAAGAIGPAAGKAIGAGAQKLRDYFAARISGLDPSTLSRLGRAVRDDGLDPAAIGRRMDELGPDAMLMDLGPNLQRQAGALAATPGRGQEVVRGAIGARDAAANARIRGAIDDTLGPAPVPSRVDAGIRANQQALSPAYDEVFRNASPVDTSGIARYLNREIAQLRGDAQRGVSSIRSMLNKVGSDQLDTSPRVLFETRKAIDGMLETAKDSNVIGTLATARQAVDDLLASAVPGIKDVDAQFAELARQRGAFSRGQQVLESGRTAPRPQELAQEFAEGALPQGRQVGPSAVPMRLRQGARDEIERIIGTNVNDRVALQRIIKGEGDWNRSRLATLFGQERADRIIGVLDRERLFADTSQVVTRNSETAARTAAMQEIAGETGPQFGVREGYMSGGLRGVARSAGVRTVERLRDMITGAHREAQNVGLAEALASRDLTRVAEALGRSQSLPATDRSIQRAAIALLIGGGTAAARP